ncbi:MAG: Asp-tRNA(Asn)/Glu-tRNA(Gln) amidotransferase subunit GatC [Syntrophobacterales bacterium]|nr:Asp-tRNA(Asn)/Glu-tRNA(Gln) amidotransferase subunit GatC [Syntrophobacterales bacterium]
MKEGKISLEEVKHIAKLARLRLSENEEELMTHQLNNILLYMEKLNELDTSNIEPMHHAVEQVNVMRDDKLKPSLSSEKALSNAPQQNGVFFVVPKVL